MDTHLMLVFSNPTEGKETEFNTWYEGTHIPEMLGTPGVVAARRYEMSPPEGMPAPPQKYLAVYELDGDLAEVFAAINERGQSGAISRGEATDRESVAMWVYAPPDRADHRVTTRGRVRMATEEELFSGKTAVITGAGSGIGAALARHAAGLGMRLVLADVAEERLAEVAAEVGGSAEILAVRTDVTDAAAVDRLAGRAYDELGPVRLLFNNAGIESTGPLWALTPQRWDLMMRVNVYGVFHGISAFVPRMLADGGPASIVNTSSIGGLSTGPFQGAYIASKFAVQALTECLHMELRAQKAPIAVSVVTPGPVATQIFEDAVALEGAPGVDGYRSTMRTMLRDQGMTPDQAASIIFEGVTAGRFWIFTHPEMMQQVVTRRADMILNQTVPTPRLPT
jgi:NAD(P)-dependent dehydrogenase (short-subunit alcohol dehydrogenase family)